MLFGMLGFEDLIPLLVFGGIVMAIWALLSVISNRNSQALDRLSRLSRPASLAEIEDPTKARSKFQGLADAVKSISKPLMPVSEVEQNALKTKMANAGFRSDAAPMVYSGIRIVALAVFLLISIALFVPTGFTMGKKVMFIATFTLAGFYLPSGVLLVSAAPGNGKKISSSRCPTRATSWWCAWKAASGWTRQCAR